ncbi:MAG: hypothetical protein ACKVQK_26645 [Burkholderiales bacterium]
MLASLIGRLWRGNPAQAAAQVEFFTSGDIPNLNGMHLEKDISRAIVEANVGKWWAARRYLQKAIDISPREALGHALLGAVLAREGNEAGAQAAFARARQAEERVDAEASVGEHFHRRGREYLRGRHVEEAMRCLTLAHRLMPESSGPLEMLGISGYYWGDVRAARYWLDMAIERAGPGERGALRVNRLVFTVPQVFSSAEELMQSRGRFERELDDLIADPPLLADPARAVDGTLFYMCFQARNDRELNTRFANMLLASCPQLGYVAERVASVTHIKDRKPRIGFVSAFLRGHSVGAWYRDLVRMLIESGRFETVLFTDSEVDEDLLLAAQQHGEHHVLETNLDVARKQIETAQLDMLIYTDVALSRPMYCLSFSRLAPIQTLLVGHPCTSGVPSIDFFISNVYQDGEGAQAHYSERLVRLPRIPVYVRKTEAPRRHFTRAELGLAPDRRYYMCPMLLQKFHPDFDWAMAQILRGDTNGEIFLFEDPKKPWWRETLEARFHAVMPDVATRIVFQPLAPTEIFLNLLLAADCLLDPFHFSGGVTTYIELSLGLPVVTLPGEFFRGRMTAGIYAQAGVTDCVARDREHYVELALELAANKQKREEVSQKIIAAHPQIFATQQAVMDLADWIERTAKALN